MYSRVHIMLEEVGNLDWGWSTQEPLFSPLTHTHTHTHTHTTHYPPHTIHHSLVHVHKTLCGEWTSATTFAVVTNSTHKPHPSHHVSAVWEERRQLCSILNILQEYMSIIIRMFCGMVCVELLFKVLIVVF